MRQRKPNLEWTCAFNAPETRIVRTDIDWETVIATTLASTSKQRIAKKVIPALVTAIKRSLGREAPPISAGVPVAVLKLADRALKSLGRWGGLHQQPHSLVVRLIDDVPTLRLRCFIDPRNRKRVIRCDPDHFHILTPQSDYDE